MKKRLLLLTLALACLSCLFAVSLAAEGDTTPTLSLDYTNLSFSDAVYLKYAVSAENVTLDDVRLLVWTAPQSDYTDASKATVLLPKYLDEINGKEYIIFDYTDLAAKQMTDVVYARATVKVNGKSYYSNIKKYSILQYALTAIDNPNIATSLKNLLNGMLDYGALAQTHFKYKADRPANGAWFSVQVVNGTLADGFADGLYMPGDELTLIPAAAPKGQMFSHWLNAAGEEQTLPLVAPAKEETYTAVYKDKPHSMGLAYSLNADGETYTLTGMGECKDTEIIIPGTYNGKKVTAIAEKAFADETEITSIRILEGVSSIGKRAFYGCTSLTELSVPTSVTSIGTQFVYKCQSLTTVYYNAVCAVDSSAASFLNQSSIKHVIFNGTKIPAYILKDCTSVQTVTIGENVTSIGSAAFWGCSSLTSITIPDSVTSIGGLTFYGCSGLTSIEIPDSVTYIDYAAFYGCTNLKSVYITDLEQWCNARYYSGFENADLYVQGELVTEIAIPATVTKVRDYLFAGFSSLTSITIPDSVTSIGNSAFSGCSGLTSITIPDSVTSIGIEAFDGCSSLTSITIPDSVTSIDYRAFYGCSGLTSITIPDSVTSIGSYAFAYCSSLTSITIPDSVTIIGDDAFYRCESLTSITIPDSVTSIGRVAFLGCSSLTTVKISASITNIPGSEYIYDSDYSGLYGMFSGCTNLTTVIFAEGSILTSIGEYAFSGCSSLTSITIPDSVTSIGKYAFEDCSSLTSITIPDSVTGIGEAAFYGCSSLTSITIPDSVTGIGNYAFDGCSSLTSITIPDSVTSIGNYAFDGCSSLTSITIPDSVTSIGYCAFNGCTSLKSVYITDLEKWCNSQYDSGFENADLYVQGELVIEIAIPTTVTKVRDYLFAGFSSLTSIEIPDSVTSIGDSAFEGCSSLTSIEIPDSVTGIGDSAFEGCSSLTSITIPDSVTGIGEAAFYGCSSLTSITFGENSQLTSIGVWAFGFCRSLVSITIPDSVTIIGYRAFYNCSLKNVTFADPYGWYVTTTENGTSGTDLDLSDAEENYYYLLWEYYAYYWYKE